MFRNLSKFFFFHSVLVLFFLSACSNDEGSTAGGGTVGGNAITVASVSGVVQKGPFAMGSKVIAYELDGDSLRQTGKAFVGKTDKYGAFELNNVSLASQYAILEGSGYFFNEVTGEKSLGQITLNALVDLKERDHVNINFLTQLEYDRVEYLVTHEGMSVTEAKQKAEEEIVKTFFGVDDSLQFEDLNIFGEGEGDAMLLAMSTLALANNSDGDFSELLAEFSADIEEDGIFDDAKRRAEMADFAAVYLDLAKVRKNVESFDSSKVPDFEKYIYKFWASEYGLGECSKENEGELKVNASKSSGRRTANFVCHEGAWKISLKNNEFKYGTFTDERDGYVYRTTTIGKQTWFAENLRYATKEDILGYFCYDDTQLYCDLYGYHYTHKSVSCPAGWHMPSRDEWQELFDAVGGIEHAATKLRARGAWNANEYPRTLEDKDEFGFSAMPYGVYGFGDEGHSGYFRVSDITLDSLGKEVESSYVVGICDGDSTWVGNARYSTAVSVRCIKD